MNLTHSGTLQLSEIKSCLNEYQKFQRGSKPNIH